jgi:hypothetical protein
MFASALPPHIASGQVPLTTVQIAQRASPSVVVIQGKTDSGDVLGSGFIISKDGKIVTNLHVARDMKTSTVQLANGEIFDSVSVLATDERRDLAILQVAGFDLPTLDLGNSDVLAVGEPIVMVGSPKGLEGSVTAGILSSIRDTGDGYKVLQTDAAMNPGNSGGPFLNNRGQAIGVASFKLRSAEGLNFAIPINYVRDVRGLLNSLHEPISLEQMRDGLGVGVSTVQEDKGPSLKETLDWLKEKIPLATANLMVYWKEKGNNISINKQATAWSLESCSAEFGVVQTETTPDYPTRPPMIFVRRNAVRLGNLGLWRVYRGEVASNTEDFISGDRWGYYVLLGSKANDIYSVLTQSQPPNSPPYSLSVSYIEITFPDESMARRVAEAFHHASDLCRGKEPF